MRNPASRSVLSLVGLVTVTALTLAGCSSGSDKKSSSSTSSTSSTPSTSSSSSASPSPSSTVKVPSGTSLTDQGSKLSFGDTARVIFEPTRKRGTVLQVSVRKVRQGSIKDFKGFILDDAYKKKASYYYASVRVKNIGSGNVGGVSVPLWGVNDANTLLPAVNFTTGFAKCPSTPLPKKFGPGKSVSTCLVYLSPKRGALEAISYRPSQEFNPITWTGTIAKPTTPAKKPATKKTKKG